MHSVWVQIRDGHELIRVQLQTETVQEEINKETALLTFCISSSNSVQQI